MSLKSKYVCQRCGLGIVWWLGSVFKHTASGGTGPGCGRTPLPVLREQFEREVQDLLNARVRVNEKPPAEAGGRE